MTSTPWYGNLRGGGGSKAKMPSVGWCGYFSELHIIFKAIDMVSHDMKKLCLRLTEQQK